MKSRFKQKPLKADMATALSNSNYVRTPTFQPAKMLQDARISTMSPFYQMLRGPPKAAFGSRFRSVRLALKTGFAKTCCLLVTNVSFIFGYAPHNACGLIQRRFLLGAVGCKNSSLSQIGHR
jgi:hypothetical protein